MDASLLIGPPIAVWALILLGYALVRMRRDRVEHHKLTELNASKLDEN
jgi:hypothetical protein